jgi:hypothetical protein
MRLDQLEVADLKADSVAIATLFQMTYFYKEDTAQVILLWLHI